MNARLEAQEKTAQRVVFKPTLMECDQCHSLLSSEDIDINTGHVNCKHCGYEADFYEKRRKDPNRRPEMLMPNGVDLLKTSRQLEIDVNWYKNAPSKQKFLGLLGSLLIPILALLVFLFLFIRGDVFFLVFFFGHIFSTINNLKYVLAGLLNKSKIHITEGYLTITSSPIKSIYKDIKVPIDNIEQLYVTKKISKKRPARSGTRYQYALVAILTNGRRVNIIGNLDKEALLYLEQEIELFLDIKDAIVRDEISRAE